MRNWLAIRFVRCLPRRVVYFAGLRLWAFAVSGQYDKTKQDKLTLRKALVRLGRTM